VLITLGAERPFFCSSAICSGWYWAVTFLSILLMSGLLPWYACKVTKPFPVLSCRHIPYCAVDVISYGLSTKQ
jgi:hypothetical protein